LFHLTCYLDVTFGTCVSKRCLIVAYRSLLPLASINTKLPDTIMNKRDFLSQVSALKNALSVTSDVQSDSFTATFPGNWTLPSLKEKFEPMGFVFLDAEFCFVKPGETDRQVSVRLLGTTPSTTRNVFNRFSIEVSRL